MLVSTMKNNVLIPREFKNIIPATCRGLLDEEGNTVVECGKELEISDTFTEVYCSNPSCPNTLYNRLKLSLVELGIDVEDKDIRDFIVKFGITSVYDLFQYNPKEDGTFTDDFDEEDSEAIYEILHTNTLNLAEYVYTGKYRYLTNIEELLQIFEEYKDLKTFYKDLKEKSVFLLQSLLDITEENKYDYDSVYEQVMSGEKYLIRKLSIESDVPYEEIIEKTKENGRDYIVELIDSISNTVSVYCIKLYNAFMEHAEELLGNIEYVKVG